MILRIVMVAALMAVLFGTYVRVIGSNPEDWHIDPETAAAPGRTGYALHGDTGPVWSQSPQDLIAKLEAVALDSPRTMLLAGNAASGHITLETRSLLWGFPDYTTIKAVPDTDGTRLEIFARARYGANDWGANQTRVEQWLAALASEVPPQ